VSDTLDKFTFFINKGIIFIFCKYKH